MEKYTEKKLLSLDDTKIKDIAKHFKIFVRSNSRKDTLIKKILETQESQNISEEISKNSKVGEIPFESTLENKKEVTKPTFKKNNQVLKANELSTEKETERSKELSIEENNQAVKVEKSSTVGGAKEIIIESKLNKGLEFISDKKNNVRKSIKPIPPFLIQINKSNLLDYFGAALIYPANYETNQQARQQRAKDIQELQPNYLLISNGFTDELDKNQVLLDISLNETDINLLRKVKSSEGIYFFPYPLPISRINKIYFLDKEAQDNSLATAKTFDDIFLPTHLFGVWDSSLKDKTEEVKKKTRVAENPKLNQDKKEEFNRILGMLAFMKNAELYYTHETKSFANYSEKYLQVLSLINSNFKNSEVSSLDKNNLEYYSSFILPNKPTTDKVLKNIINIIYANENFVKSIFKEGVLGELTDNEKIQEAFKLLFKDKTVEALQAIDETKNPTLILLAFLYRFQNKNEADKFAIKKQIPRLINRKELKQRALNRLSIVLATLGLYYGYRNLPKEEVIDMNDEFFSSFGKHGKFPIKYKLDNQFDRNTIESVFQYCFFGNKEGKFEFLLKNEDKLSYQTPKGYKDESFSIIGDYPILRIKKQHTQKQKEAKEKTITIIQSIKLFLEYLKKNALAQIDAKGNIIFDEKEFEIWLHNNPLFALEKEINKFEQTKKDEPTNDKK